MFSGTKEQTIKHAIVVFVFESVNRKDYAFGKFILDRKDPERNKGLSVKLGIDEIVEADGNVDVADPPCQT